MRPSRSAEFIMGRLLPDATGRRPGRIQRRIFSLARRFLAKQTNKYIRYELSGTVMLLPFAHDLPIFRSAFPQYSTNIGRLCCYMSEKYTDLRLVDIGANIGDTVAIVRENSQCPILCVEADKHYFTILMENLRRAGFQSVEAVNAFVSSYTGELRGQLVSDGGTAHFIASDAPPIRTVKLSLLLSDFPQFQSPKLVKIDTDGYDCSILKAEIEWLKEKKPAIFFEYDPFFFSDHPYDGARIFKDLREAGYVLAIFYDNVGDYLATVDLEKDGEILVELQNYYVGRGGHHYADVAVFHREDRDIAERIRVKEAEWSLHQRSVKSRMTK